MTRRRSHFSRISLATILAIAIFSVTAGATYAHSTGSPHWFGDCDAGNASYNATGHLVRTKPAIYGAKARAVIRELRSCTNPNDSLKEGFSAVLPANIQGSSGLLAQLGYAYVDCVDNTILPCLDFMPDSIREFVWTPNSNGNGVFRPATWYDFNNDGTHDRPILNHEYEFSVAYLGPTGDKYWSYCIKDLSANTPTDCTSNDATNAGTQSWYGYEIFNDASQIGQSRGGPPINLYYMGYRLTQGGTYQILTDDATCSWAHNTPSWATCEVLQSPPLGEGLNVWTWLHS